MFSKFMSLDQEKRDRIINAAMREFSHKGFDDASTNEIVKEAGISKGLLFHYFKSKSDLFRFLCDYIMEFLETEYGKAYETLNSADVFERLKQLSMFKVNLILRSPELYNFALAVATKTHGKLHDGMSNRVKSFNDNLYKRIYEGLDVSGFRDGIDVSTALDIIRWTLEGYGNKLLSQYSSLSVEELEYERYEGEIEELYDILKKGVYK